jgi:hypothetical protein
MYTRAVLGKVINTDHPMGYGWLWRGVELGGIMHAQELILHIW